MKTNFTPLLMLSLLMSPALSVLASPLTPAKSVSELITDASIIALIDIKSVEKIKKTDYRPTGFPFQYYARASSIESLSGHPDSLTIYSRDSHFGLRQRELRRGETLAFLTYDSGQLVSCGGDLSLCHVDGGKLNWLKNENSTIPERMKVSDVVSEIKAKLPPPVALSEPLKILLSARSLDAQRVGKGELSTYWITYHEALKTQKEAEVNYVLKTGSSAGRLYAAMLIYHRDMNAGKAALESLKQSASSVTYQVGCECASFSMSEVVDKLLQTGRFREIVLE